MKFFIVFCLIFLVIFESCISRKKYNSIIQSSHSIEELQNDVDATYKQFKKYQPLLYQYISKDSLEYSFDSLKNSFTQPLNSKEFAKRLAPVVAKIKQGHNAVIFPNTEYSKKQLKGFKKLQFNFNKLEFDMAQDTIFVKRDISKDSVLRKLQVLKINDENILDIINRGTKYITSDGYNTTFQKKFIAQNIQGEIYRLNGRQDSISVTFRNKDSIFVKKFKRYPAKNTKTENPKQDTVKIKPNITPIAQLKDTVQIKTNSINTLKEENKVKISKREAKKLKKDSLYYNKLRDYKPSSKRFARNFTFLGKDSTVGYLKINSFSGNKQKKFYEETFAKIKAAHTQYLIIDVRDNYGGSLDEINNLYAYLVNQNFVFLNPSQVSGRGTVFRTTFSNLPLVLKFFMALSAPVIYPYMYFKTSKDSLGNYYYHFNASKKQKSKPNHFNGPIYVLINGTSFSASCILSTALDSRENVTYIGEETGGDYNGTVAGYFRRYKLPHTKVKISMGITYDSSINKRAIKGRGVFPDVKIQSTYQDFLKDLDAELNWALQDIQSQKP